MGSMDEGIAIGLESMGAVVEGTRMAGLLGAVYDECLPNSDLVVKLPVERLYAVDGTPREEFDPHCQPRRTEQSERPFLADALRIGYPFKLPVSFQRAWIAKRRHLGHEHSSYSSGGVDPIIGIENPGPAQAAR
jgi:hypothetical protein